MKGVVGTADQDIRGYSITKWDRLLQPVVVAILSYSPLLTLGGINGSDSVRGCIMAATPLPMMPVQCNTASLAQELYCKCLWYIWLFALAVWHVLHIGVNTVIFQLVTCAYVLKSSVGSDQVWIVVSKWMTLAGIPSFHDTSYAWISCLCKVIKVCGSGCHKYTEIYQLLIAFSYMCLDKLVCTSTGVLCYDSRNKMGDHSTIPGILWHLLDCPHYQLHKVIPLRILGWGYGGQASI